MNKVPRPYIGAAYDSLLLVVDRAGRDKRAFLDDSLLQDATLMRLLDAGEQLARLRDLFPEYYAEHSSPAWDRLIGLRNIIAHGYAIVDFETIWEVIAQRLPDLIATLKRLS